MFGVAAMAWYVWLPSYRPGLRAGESYGVDVSHHQGGIDWRRVAADDITFAYIKATEGGGFVDPQFATNWAAAKEAGLRRGAYHFFTLCASGAAQARNFLDNVPAEPTMLPPAVDLELTGNCKARPELATVEGELGTFLQLVEQRFGQVATVYLLDDFADRYSIRAVEQRPRWVRGFRRPSGGQPWVVWQVHGRAKVDGIRGQVDLDLRR